MHLPNPLPAIAYDADTRVYLSADALIQIVGDEAVLLDVASEQYFGLNEVAARLWQLLGSNPQLAPACQTLLREYEVTPARLQRDIGQLIADLQAAGLVRLAQA